MALMTVQAVVVAAVVEQVVDLFVGSPPRVEVVRSAYPVSFLAISLSLGVV